MSAACYVHGVSDDPARRHPADFYPTPPRGTQALLNVEQFRGLIWEPACGDGAISRVLEDAGHSVLSTDLHDYGYGTPGIDFLADDSRARNIVTNPPFKLAQEFAEHALAHTTNKVALLLRLAWLEGKARRRMFESTPLARVWVFSGRLTMKRGGTDGGKGGGSMVAFAWFVWDHSHKGAPTIGWLP